MPPREGDLDNIEIGNGNGNGNSNDRTPIIPDVTQKPQLTVPQDEKAQDYEAVLEAIGFGKTQWIMLLTCGMLLMFVINETMGISIIIITSQCDFSTTSVDKAILGAAAFIGILCSSYFWGYFSDTLGRRTILIYTTFTGNCISFLSLFVPNFWPFVSLRFLTGIFIAGASSTTYAYLGEFYIPRHRPVVINYASMFVGVSMAYTPAVAWAVLTMDWSFSFFGAYDFRPWRLLIILNLLPGLIAALVLLKLPESPKLLMCVGKEKEALEAVNWIYRTNTGAKTPLDVCKLKAERKIESDSILATKTGMGILKKMWRDTAPLFKQPHVGNFLISCFIMAGFFFTSSGMGLWFPEIQNRVAAVGDDDSMTVCQVIDASIEVEMENSTHVVCNDHINRKSYIDSITFGLSYIVGYIILGIVINPLGRKWTMIGALTISGISGIVLHFLLDPIAIVVVFCLFLMLPGLCVSVLSGAVVDLVPTHLRGKAVCICLMLGRSGSVLGSNLIGLLLESYCTVTFSVFSGFVLVCAALTLTLPI